MSIFGAAPKPFSGNLVQNLLQSANQSRSLTESLDKAVSYNKYSPACFFQLLKSLITGKGLSESWSHQSMDVKRDLAKACSATFNALHQDKDSNGEITVQVNGHSPLTFKINQDTKPSCVEMLVDEHWKPVGELSKLLDALARGIDECAEIEGNGRSDPTCLLESQDAAQAPNSLESIATDAINTAATKIQTAFRDFKERQAVAINQAKRAGESYAFMNYKATEERGRCYVFDVTKQQKAIYAPKQEPASELCGSSKYVAGMDQRFVALAPRTPRHAFNPADNQKMAILRGMTSVKLNTIVSRYLMIAANGGTDISEMIYRGQTINVNAFRNAAQNLKLIHESNIYLVDIKPDNMTYDGKNACFIDVDSFIAPGASAQDAIYTIDYTTDKLLNKSESGSAYLKTMDEYAFLLTMMESTIKDQSFSDGMTNQSSFQSRDGFIAKGNLTEANNRICHEWIEKNVRPQYRSDVVAMLENPVNYTEAWRHKVALSDMLNFSVSS